MNKISAFIITKNEENKIERTLKNIKNLVDEIVIIDGYSTDKTYEIAKKYGAKVIHHSLKSFSKQKNLAIKNCRNKWILDIDADEILYPETKKEILQILKAPEYDAYYIRREEFYLYKKVMEIKLIRFYKKNKSHYEGCVHEVLKVNGKAGMLKGKMKHEQYKYVTVFSEMNKMNKYSDLEMKKIEDSGVKLSRAKNIWLITFLPIKHFFGFLLYKGTIRGGWVGVWEAYLAAHNQFLVYLKYYEKHYVKKEKK